MYEKLNSSLLNFLSNKLGWSNLNSIQIKAIPSILDDKDTLILAPTASGKTEAALIPIFSEIINKQLEPVSVLYVAPLKALINDIHNRIESWGNYFGIPVMKWHGDVGPSKRNKFIKNPTDFLAITPESLEVILMNKQSGVKEKLFKNLKYIVIDEIHYFADSDRGVQLNSILNRVSKYFSNDVVTIGLSATVGNPELIAQWINTDNPANIIKVDGASRFKYKIINLDEENRFDFMDVIKKYKDSKILIFGNSKNDVETIHFRLKNELKLKNVFIHHGSIGKEIREENEKRFKAVKTGIMVSTNTLELGIDIGDLDIVINFEMPTSASSFSQRVGRSGRRTKEQKCINIESGNKCLYALSEVMLHKEGKTEEINISKESKDILFHQILSRLFETGNVHVKDLYSELHNCYAFLDISYHDFKFQLNDMRKREFVEINNNYINLGIKFEEKFGRRNFMNFYAVFHPTYEYTIFEGDYEVGGLDAAYAINLSPGEDFVLAGQYWNVKDIDHEKFLINVYSKGTIKEKVPQWHGMGKIFSYLVCRKVYDILINNFDERHLNPCDIKSRETIKTLIEKSLESGFSEGIVPVYIDNNKNIVFIYTFAGVEANLLLRQLFSMKYDISGPNPTNFYVTLKSNDITQDKIESIFYNVESIINEPTTEKYFNDELEAFEKNKFIEYLPDENCGKLKMDILYDKEGLIDLSKNNMIFYIDNNEIYKYLSKSKTKIKEESEEEK